MIAIDVLAFNPFQVNTYVVSEPGGECVIIDAGNYSAGEDRIMKDFIEGKGLRPVMALNTHGHVDHILGVEFVKSTFGVPFALDGRDGFLVETAPEHGAIYGFRMKSTPAIDIDLQNTGEVMLGGEKLRIIHTPGHTPGHICIYHEESKSLFCGDTVFRESIGRTDLPGGDYSWIMKSILDKIIPLGPDVTLYPGHGPKSDIGHEAMYNPFITEVLGGEVSYK